MDANSNVALSANEVIFRLPENLLTVLEKIFRYQYLTFRSAETRLRKAVFFLY
jgi:hypothetical protein